MKKTVISRKVTIDAPKEKVWKTLADFGNVYKLSPNLLKSYSTSDKANGLGATRHCDFASMGAQVEERIVEWKEGESMKIDIYEVKNMPMVSAMEAQFSVESKGDQTVLSGIFSYGMTNAIGGLINNLAMKKMNIKAWNEFIGGIKHHVETGEEVNKETVLDLSLVQEN
jgi:carbon monoxide dehydrogenase subunit G